MMDKIEWAIAAENLRQMIIDVAPEQFAELQRVKAANAALHGIIDQLRTAAVIADWETFDRLVKEAKEQR